jgi:hypothetical protein
VLCPYHRFVSEAKEQNKTFLDERTKLEYERNENREVFMVRRFAADVFELTAVALLVVSVILWAKVLSG